MASAEEKSQRRRPPLFVKYFGTKGVTVEDYSVESLREFQDEAVRQLVARAYSKNPFYRQKMQSAGVRPKDVQGTAQLHRIPFTTKDELRQDPWLLLACDREDVSLIHVSTGTTGGKEIYLPWTWHDYYRNELTPAMTKLASRSRSIWSWGSRHEGSCSQPRSRTRPELGWCRCVKLANYPEPPIQARTRWNMAKPPLRCIRTRSILGSGCW